MGIEWSALGALFFSGLSGGLGHCLGMCGPLTLMVGARFPQKSLSFSVAGYLLYHAGRVLVYAGLGFLVGLLGSFLGLGNQFFHFSAIASLVFGSAIILVGMGYLRLLPFSVEASGGSLAVKSMGRFLQSGNQWGLLPLGALTGLLPCGLLYSSLLVAASSGNPYWGALGMLLFGIGTIPALFIFGMGAGRLGARTRKVFARFARLFIVLVGLQLALRGLASLGAIQHLEVGSLMVW